MTTLTRIVAAALGLALAACTTPSASRHQVAHDAFFERLSALCGKAFAGRVAIDTPAATGPDPFAGKPLVMHVRECGDTVRVPFHVGEDRSRTWVFTRTAGGVRLKHDHRHADGKPDSVTQYGGDSRAGGTAALIDFPADAFTANLIPAARTNVWTVELTPIQFVYRLRREGTDRRVRVEFDLTKPVPAPPAPWGHR